MTKRVSASELAGTGRRMTMDDLAELAGVSKITVSRALKDSALVRAPVREQIQQLARTHGYRLNTAARNLRLRRNHSVTVVINMTPTADRTMSDPIFLGLVGGLLQCLTAANYRLVLTTADQVLASGDHDSDGIIFLGQGTDDTLLGQVSEMGLPFVVWGARRATDGDWITIGSDNRRGGALIGQHLAALGRRDVLFLGDQEHQEVADRLTGLEQGGGATMRVTARACEFGMLAGRAAVDAAIEGGWRGDAIVGASDMIALGAMDALIARNIAIPDDMVVIGYDGIPAAANAAIPLTTVRQDWQRAGELLGETMLAWVEGTQPNPETLPVELIVRASTQAD
ncbi:LacI family DNA-binding transcriptional regulator [Sphingomonas panacisoli]|uniref:LacI family DNA-binding transcriptional regulator n=1 Tax=Sphingomonas panacisoli TaxID=1813879 RepID=A0A5B8LLC8_9SPHN|nr:substrate-binding domain-containing protein [Sphingomonas panacisoli]QDZ07860.1 LacI family DNA-binding transcriptional regulator [Sphingomonas panacisoli]